MITTSAVKCVNTRDQVRVITGRVQAATHAGTGHVGKPAQHHYSGETVIAMSLLGVAAIAGALVGLLLCGVMLRYIVGGKRNGKAVQCG